MILIYKKEERTWYKDGSPWTGSLNCDHFTLMAGTRIVNIKKVIDQSAMFVMDENLGMTSFPCHTKEEHDAIIVKEMRKLERT